MRTMKWRSGLWREVGILAASTRPDGREHSEDDGPADGALQGKNSYENKLHISGNNNLTPSLGSGGVFSHFPRSRESLCFRTQLLTSLIC